MLFITTFTVSRLFCGMNEKVAIIDLGTNTFHLLIADTGTQKPEIIHHEKVGVKLGKAGINQDYIQPDAVNRAIITLQNFCAKMQQYEVSKVHAFGTSALRNAKNAKEVTDQIKSATDIDISIISGDEEAEMIYQGVRSALDLGTDISLIMDIGAGSVEFILANQEKTFWKKSLEIGAQRILEKFSISDPITPSEIESLDTFFNESLKEVDHAVKLYPPKMLIGSSGTFDTLSDVYCMEKNIQSGEHDSETPLTLDYFHSIYGRIIKMSRAERMTMLGMIELRVDLIVVGCCLVRYLIEKYKIEQIRVSRYSLKEGALSMLSN